MNKGKVKWFSAEKGFGFISSEGEEKDIFVHFSQINSDGYRKLCEGDEVEFELIKSESGLQAQNVTKLMKENTEK